ncbi:MAG: IgiC, partial [Betaproteobacteria bacterium]|nr:IgiC [Betaproteobacteria bacterium]
MKFGVITPSANTVVQPEYDAMRPAGVTNHIFRMAVKNPPWSKDTDFVEIVRQMNVGLDDAVDQAMTCVPDHLVLGVSIESIWDGGVAASERLNERVEQRAGGSIKLTQAAKALPT